MNMNHHTRLPRPGPECESFAPLLALAGQERLDPREGSALRAHLATCDYCQAEQDAYQRLDSALQRHFGPPTQPPLSGRDIAQMIQDDEPLPARRSSPPSGAPMLRDEPSRGQAPRPLPPERPQRPQRRRAVVISTISAVAAVLIIALVSVALFASRGHVITGQQKTPTATQNVAPTATPAPYTPNPNDTFNSIAMVSPNEGWIVGGSGSHAGPLIVHYLNGSLFQANVVAPPSGWPPLSLQHVVMSSATEGWAVGPVEGLCPSTLLLHYTRGQWKLDSTMTGTTLDPISMLSPTDGWAIGEQEACGQGSYKPVLFHYNGTTWTPVQLPADVIQVTGVSMTSATDGWAVGTRQNENSNLLLHYDGQTWSEVNTTGIAQYGVNLGDITMISATNGWLVGVQNQGPNATVSGSLLFHYDGKQWSKVNTPLDAIQQGAVLSLSLASSGDGWLAGRKVLDGETFFLQLSGGTWKKVDSPTGEFVSQVFTLSANDAWAIGPGIGQGQLFLLHYHNGAWKNVSLTPTPTATATGTANAPPCSSQGAAPPGRQGQL